MKEKNLRLKLQKKLEFKIGHTQYILHQDRVYKVRMYANDSVLVTDITDAGKTGKVCHELGISTKHSAPTCAIWNEIFRDHWKTIFNLTTSKISPANCFNRDYFNYRMGNLRWFIADCSRSALCFRCTILIWYSYINKLSPLY